MLAIVQTDNAVFDLALSDNADLTAAASIAYIALFTDAQQPKLDSLDKRGWFDDPEVGSLIWWLRRQPLSDAVREQVKNEILEQLAVHGLSDVDIVELTTARNVSSVSVTIAATHNGTQQLLTINL